MTDATYPTDALEDRTAVVRRRMPVPVRYVFLAHAKAEHLMRWFGPVGYPVTSCELDFRVGGKWRMVMTGPDGKEGPPFGGRFLEIVPDRKIVYSDAFEDGKGGDMNLQSRGEIIFTYDFAADGDATDVTLTLTFPTAAMKAEYIGVGMLEGIASGHDQLIEVATELWRG
jgi:uncharacterized protein YndB with AHSA1/START domain